MVLEETLFKFFKLSDNASFNLMQSKYLACRQQLKEVCLKRYTYLQEAKNYAVWLGNQEAQVLVQEKLDQTIEDSHEFFFRKRPLAELVKNIEKQTPEQLLKIIGKALEITNQECYKFQGIYYHYYFFLIFVNLTGDNVCLKVDQARLAKLNYLMEEVIEAQEILRAETKSFLSIIDL